MAILFFILPIIILALLGVAAQAWGVDSREDFDRCAPTRAEHRRLALVSSAASSSDDQPRTHTDSLQGQTRCAQAVPLPFSVPALGGVAARPSGLQASVASSSAERSAAVSIVCRIVTRVDPPGASSVGQTNTSALPW